MSLPSDTGPDPVDPSDPADAAGAADQLPGLLLEGHASILETIEVHRERWGLGSESRWTLDQGAQTITWSFDDGRSVTAPAQLLGSWSRDSGTFVWAWDNPTVHAELRRTSERVRAFGVEHEIFALTASPLRLEEQQTMDLVALAFRVGECTGLVPPARGEDLTSYVVFGPVRITLPDGSVDTFEVNRP